MKAIKNIFIAAVFLLLVVGCGGSGGGSDDHDDDYDIAYLEVVNAEASDSNICNIYSVPSADNYWGEDLLSGTLAPGYYETFDTYDCDRSYDLKVVFCDGIEDEIHNFYLACGDTRTFVFQNW